MVKDTIWQQVSGRGEMCHHRAAARSRHTCHAGKRYQHRTAIDALRMFGEAAGDSIISMYRSDSMALTTSRYHDLYKISASTPVSFQVELSRNKNPRLRLRMIGWPGAKKDALSRKKVLEATNDPVPKIRAAALYA